MFLRLLFLVALIGITRAAVHNDLLVGPVDIQKEWAKWKVDYNKNYPTPEEESKRFKIFEDNVKECIEHNKEYLAGKVLWAEGLTKFSDLTQDEFAKFYLHGFKPPKDPKFVGPA